MCFGIFVRDVAGIHKLHVRGKTGSVMHTNGRGRRGLNGTVDNNLSATRMGCVRLIYIGVHNSLPVLCRRPLRCDGQMTMAAKCRRHTQGNTRVDPAYGMACDPDLIDLIDRRRFGGIPIWSPRYLFESRSFFFFPRKEKKMETRFLSFRLFVTWFARVGNQSARKTAVFSSLSVVGYFFFNLYPLTLFYAIFRPLFISQTQSNVIFFL